MKQSIYTIALILLSAVSLRAQNIEFNANLNRQVVGLNEQFELILEISGSDAGDVDQPPVPDVNGFARFIGSSQASNFQFINGRMSTSKTYTLHFMATKEGKHQIPRISFQHDGKSYSTGPLALEIVARRSTRPPARTPSQQPKSPDDSEQDLSELLYLNATVDKKRVYLNEPVVVTYRIYTALSVTNYGISQIPNTVGFWSEEFDTGKRPSVYTETVNGRAYKVAVIKKMALFPQSPGKKELGPMVVDCEVQLPASRKRSDPFDSFFSDSFFRRTVTRTISSNLATIEVLPLPEENKPADFSGLVGNFSISATVDRNTTKTNEAITLKTKISGTGNVKIIPQPAFDIPADFESYEPKVVEDIRRNNNLISGSKTFEYVLIPRFAGQHRIKPIALSFFDPMSKRYNRISTDAIDITVEKGVDQYTGVGIATSKEDVRFIGQDIRFIQTRLPDFARHGVVIYKRWYFFFLLIVPWIAVASVFAVRRHQDKMLSNVAYARSRKASQMANRFLKTAGRKMSAGNPREFYSEVSKALMGFLADKLNVAAAGLITDNAQQLMQDRNVAPDTIDGYIDCLRTCDYQRFAPSDSDNGEMQSFLERAKQAIIELDRAL